MLFRSDDERGEAFQVYVTPYADKQVTSQQFTLDEPSGVKKDAKDVMIGGVRGTMFFSTNTSLGNTREVWFIKNGFLYEVTTYQELDAWLSQIMTTWKFL